MGPDVRSALTQGWQTPEVSGSGSGVLGARWQGHYLDEVQLSRMKRRVFSIVVIELTVFES